MGVPTRRVSVPMKKKMLGFWEEEGVRVLGLSYLQVLQMGRQDKREEHSPVMTS